MLAATSRALTWATRFTGSTMVLPEAGVYRRVMGDEVGEVVGAVKTHTVLQCNPWANAHCWPAPTPRICVEKTAAGRGFMLGFSEMSVA